MHVVIFRKKNIVAIQSLLFPVFILAVSLCLLTRKMATAQHENIWILPYNLGLDFNTGSPPTVVNSAISSIPFAPTPFPATACDLNGQLLFYTDGATVWNNQHNIMPNGTNIIPGPTHWSLPNFGKPVITPVPNNTMMYYIFSIHANGTLYYSIVDMTMNGGLGDVITGSKSMFIDSGLTQQIQAVAGEQCDLWLLTVAKDKNLCAYNINDRGVNMYPVKSALPYAADYPNMDISPNRKMIGITVGNLRWGLYTFSPLTGKITDTLLTFGRGREVCFSPDNSKLYVQNMADLYPNSPSSYVIDQYDLLSGDSATVINSKTIVGYLVIGGGMRRGPDDKIYERQEYFTLIGGNGVPNGLSTIDFPNLSGALCQYSKNSLPFGPLTGTYPLYNIGFPQIIMQAHDSFKKYQFTAGCFNSPVKLVPEEGKDYLWNDGSRERLKEINQPGIYWVTYSKYCTNQTDTFKVGYPRFPELLTTNACRNGVNGTAQMNNQDGDSLSYQYHWRNSSGDTLSVINSVSDLKAGQYSVTVTVPSGCDSTISFLIEEINIIPDLGADTVICKGAPFRMTLETNAPADAGVTWSTGSRAPSIDVQTFGTYWVDVSAPPCYATDTIRISPELCYCGYWIPNAFSPNNDGNNDLFKPVLESGCLVTNYKLVIFNRWGRQVFQSMDVHKGWDGMYQSAMADLGTYYYQVQWELGTAHEYKVVSGEVTLIR